MVCTTPQRDCPTCGSTSAKVIEVPTSPVPALLGTNLIPSISEWPSVLLTASEGQSHILAIDTEVHRLQGVLDALNVKRHAIDEHVKGHQALLNPIRRFPAELLSMVFLQCLEWEITFKLPWVLGWICSGWRDIALSTQKLWSRPNFNLSSKKDVAFANTWLSRAGRCPLSISLNGHCRKDNPILTVVLNHCELWQSLNVCMSSSMIPHFAVVKNRLPRLRFLKFQSSPNLPIVDMFEVAPQLRDVSLPQEEDVFLLPWNQLTSLTITGQTVDSIINKLQQCPNLIKCNFVVYDRDTGSPGHSPIRLKHLRLLRIHGTTGLYDHLVLPALHSLDAIYADDNLRGMAWLTSLISRSLCPLQKLDIRLRKCLLKDDNDSDLVELLENVPSLIELTIRGNIVATSTAMDRLLCRSTGVCLVPNLRILDIECRSFYFEAFAEIIRSRWHMDYKAEELNHGEGRVSPNLQTIYLRLDTLDRWDSGNITEDGLLVFCSGVGVVSTPADTKSIVD